MRMEINQKAFLSRLFKNVWMQGALQAEGKRV